MKKQQTGPEPEEETPRPPAARPRGQASLERAFTEACETSDVGSFQAFLVHRLTGWREIRVHPLLAPLYRSKVPFRVTDFLPYDLWGSFFAVFEEEAIEDDEFGKLYAAELADALDHPALRPDALMAALIQLENCYVLANTTTEQRARWISRGLASPHPLVRRIAELVLQTFWERLADSPAAIGIEQAFEMVRATFDVWPIPISGNGVELVTLRASMQAAESLAAPKPPRKRRK